MVGGETSFDKGERDDRQSQARECPREGGAALDGRALPPRLKAWRHKLALQAGKDSWEIENVHVAGVENSRTARPASIRSCWPAL